MQKRCLEKQQNSDFDDGVEVRISLKARLPKALPLLQAKKFCADWLQQHPEEEQLKFSNQWIKGWELECGVFLQHHNKHYSISKKKLALEYRIT